MGGAVAKVDTLQIPPVCEAVDFFVCFLLRYWLTRGLNMAKRKQSSLPTNFGFTSKELHWDDQNVRAGWSAAANVHAGLSSD